MTKNRLLQLSREWMQRGDYDRIIRELGSIPTSRRGAKLTAMLARARMTRYEGADDAPAGWKEETIRDLEVFMDSASPEWREVLAQLKGKLDPEFQPAPEPPPPKESSREEKEPGGFAATVPPVDIRITAMRVNSLMQDREYGEALKIFEGLEPEQLGADLIGPFLAARPRFPSTPDIQRRLRELDRRAAGWCAPSELFTLYSGLFSGTPTAALRETVLMNDEKRVVGNLPLFLFSKYLLLLQTGTAARGIAPLDRRAWALFRKEEYWKIIDRFRNRSAREMGLSNLLLFAFAAGRQHHRELSLDAGGLPSRSAETSRVMETVATLLDSVEEKGRSVVAWQIVSAEGNLIRKRHIPVVRHWMAARNLAPEDTDVKRYCEELENFQTWPFESSQLLSNAKAAWRMFEAEEKRLYNYFQEKSRLYDPEKGWAILDRVFQSIPVDSSRMVQEGKRLRMSFHLKNSPLNVFAMGLFCSLMPEKFRTRWAFVPCVEKADHPASGETWYVRIWPQKSGMLDLTMYPWFVGAEAWSDDALMRQARGDLAYQVGNLTVAVNVGSVRIDRRHPTRECILLSDLEDELKKRKCGIFPTLDSYLTGGWQWQNVENAGDADLDHLRADIHRRWSLWDKLSRNGGTGSEEDVEKWLLSGVIAAFFAIPAENVRDNRKAMIPPALEQALKAEAGPNVFQVLGWATGRQFCYLDLLTYDLEALMRAAKVCARDPVWNGLCFKTFLPYAKPIPVRDFEIPKKTITTLY